MGSPWAPHGHGELPHRLQADLRIPAQGLREVLRGGWQAGKGKGGAQVGGGGENGLVLRGLVGVGWWGVGLVVEFKKCLTA